MFCCDSAMLSRRRCGAGAASLVRVLSRLVIVVSVVVAAALAGHGLIPALGGFTPVLESLLPWIGLAVPVLLAAAAVARSTSAAAAALVPGVVWAFMFGSTLFRTPPGGPSDLAVGTVNVGVRNSASGEAVRVIAKDLDVLAAQELTRGGPAAKQLNKMFKYHYRSARSACGAATRSAGPSRSTSASAGRAPCARSSPLPRAR